MQAACAKHDVIVLGGGPAGASTALGLARAGVSVVIADRTRTRSPWHGEALPPAAAEVLARLGVWGAFLAAGHRPSPGIVADWGGGPPVETDFLFHPHGRAWHLDRARFDAGLKAAAQAAGAEILAAQRLVSCERGPDGLWSVSFSDRDGRPRTLESRGIVDATGRAALLAVKQGARLVAIDRLVALIAVAPSAPADERLVVEACAEGWWYAAGLPDGRYSLALMTDADLVPAPPDRRARFWADALRRTTTVGPLVAGREFGGRLRTVAARSARLDRAAGPGWLAAGDAALALDPLSGRGIVKALESGQAAAGAILAALGGDRDASDRYASEVDREAGRYATIRAAYYAGERRWADSPFWRRRHATARV